MKFMRNIGHMAVCFGRRHKRGERGATALEMALVAPVFFLLFIGIVEISLIALTQHLLENSTFNSSRLAKTGYVAEGKTQLDTIMEALNKEMSSLAPLVDVTKLSVTSTSYGNLSNIGQPEQGTAGLGTSGQVVVYTVSYPWKMFTPMIGNLIGDENGMVNITSRIVVKNEPY